MKDQKRKLTMKDQYLTHEEMLEIAAQREKENEALEDEVVDEIEEE